MRVRQIVNLSSFISFIELCVVNRERFLLAQCVSCERGGSVMVCFALLVYTSIQFFLMYFLEQICSTNEPSWLFLYGNLFSRVY